MSRRKISYKRANFIVICQNHDSSSYSSSCPCCLGCKKYGLPFVKYQEINRDRNRDGNQDQYDKFEGYHYHAERSISKVAAEKRLKDAQIASFTLKPCRARVPQKEIQSVNKKRPANLNDIFEEEEIVKFIQTDIAQGVKVESLKQSAELRSELSQLRKEVSGNSKDVFHLTMNVENMKEEFSQIIDSKLRSLNEVVVGVQRKQNEMQCNQERRDQELFQKQEELEEKQHILERKQEKSEEKQEKFQEALDSIAEKFQAGVSQQTSTMEQFGQTMAENFHNTLRVIQNDFRQFSHNIADRKQHVQARASNPTSSMPAPPLTEQPRPRGQNVANSEQTRGQFVGHGGDPR